MLLQLQNGFTLVDDDMYEDLEKYVHYIDCNGEENGWFITPQGYVKWSRYDKDCGWLQVYMARYIHEKKRGYVEPHIHIHHINGNKLDNRIENLLAVTNVEHGKIHAEEFQARTKNVKRNYTYVWDDERKAKHSTFMKEFWAKRRAERT